MSKGPLLGWLATIVVCTATLDEIAFKFGARVFVVHRTTGSRIAALLELAACASSSATSTKRWASTILMRI